MSSPDVHGYELVYQFKVSNFSFFVSFLALSIV